MNKYFLMKQLQLQPHMQGGYYRRIYQSDMFINLGYSDYKHRMMTSIHYMLSDDSPINHLHQNRADIVHYYHMGFSIRYYIIRPDGQLETAVLGDDLKKGQRLHLFVKGGCWQAAELLEGEFALISKVVSPGFEYEDMRLATDRNMQLQYPDIYPIISKFIKR